jgi:SAM-dependent methyltransferase
MHEIIQSYLSSLYKNIGNDIKESMLSSENEIYGELHYYSVVNLLRYIDISEEDHFLDLGFGLGKLLFQIILTTKAHHITGIEINKNRFNIVSKLFATMQNQLPDSFLNKNITLLEGDFLQFNFHSITIVYVCSTVFSFILLDTISQKINGMPSVKCVVSFRKLPRLSNFKLTRKLFLHGSWDHAVCYLYSRKNTQIGVRYDN